VAAQSFPNFYGVPITPYPLPDIAQFSNQNSTMDAAGESYFGIGYLLLSSGPGTSATISAAGSGQIHFRPGTTTFANGGTSLDIGIQDVDATGVEDGSFDVKATFVGGTDTITASVVNSATMETGSKTITHGDLVAVGFEMTARGGVSDSVIIQRSGITSLDPYGSADVGSGPARITGIPLLTVQFDNGEVGWFDLSGFAHSLSISSAFSVDSTPDEYAMVFQIPFPATATGAFARLASVAAADDFELILYSDPLGTPVAERTIVQDMTFSANTTNDANYGRTFSSPYALLANTNYAIAVRPTTSGTIQLYRLGFNTGNGALRKATPLGTNWSQYTRSNNTGAFGSQDVTLLPLFGLWLSAFDDGVSTGGAASIIGDGSAW
jgi:hypothetical protein